MSDQTGGGALPATIDNFDAIVSQYNDDAPGRQAPPPPQQQQPPAEQHHAKQPELPTDRPRGDEPPPEGEEPPPEQEQDPEQQQQMLDDIQAAQKYRELVEGEDLPDDFLKKSRVVKLPDGRLLDVSVEEAYSNFQRRALLKQNEQRAASIQQHYQQLMTSQRGQWERWGNDGANNYSGMRTELEDMGFGPALHKIAESIYQEYAQEQRLLDKMQRWDPQLQRMVPDEQAQRALQQTFQAKRQASMEARAAAKRAQHAQQQAQRFQPDPAAQDMQRFGYQMAQFGPRAAKAAGITTLNAYAKQTLSREVNAMRRQGQELTFDLVLEAAKNVKDMLDMEREQGLAQRASTQRRSGTMPRGTPNPRVGPAPHPQTTPNGRARVSDFDKIMQEQDRRAGY